ncbi:hypothetical protein ACJX0J_039436, partial [Zea mays]
MRLIGLNFLSSWSVVHFHFSHIIFSLSVFRMQISQSQETGFLCLDNKNIKLNVFAICYILKNVFGLAAWHVFRIIDTLNRTCPLHQDTRTPDSTFHLQEEVLSARAFYTA